MHNTLTKQPESNEGTLVVISSAERHYGFRFDGCLHITDIDEPDSQDYLHICDVIGFIEDLQELVKMHKEHFGEENHKYVTGN